jgi:putative intracellular protease/amidase
VFRHDGFVVFFAVLYAVTRLSRGFLECFTVFDSITPWRTLTEANERELRALVREAVVRYEGQKDGVFNTACFQQAVKRRYDLVGTPGGKWSRDVLSSLPFVRPWTGGFLWQVGDWNDPAGR